MPQAEWGKMLPQTVSQWMNFDATNPSWDYGTDHAASMAARQAEGVAYLWNLLGTRRVALLADEVGMGKTFQALGVAALLWKMKPAARVLVLAPNRDICAHWRREHEGFVRQHVRTVDHCVKNGVDGGPIHAPIICGRLAEVVNVLENHNSNFIVTTIHSLSGLVPQEQKGSDNARIAAAYAERLREQVMSATGGHGFDLMIVDEAHYFRKVDGASQRVAAARAFFGSPNAPLARHTLLMTATPSHSGLQDVANILGYFVDVGAVTDHSAQALMETYGLRRFRRMQGIDRNFSKREYRVERDVPCNFPENPESEMFFALYQKKLVTELGHTKDNKSLLYGFLEGFESAGRVVGEVGPVSSEDEEDNSGQKDFSRAPDSEMLARMAGRIHEEFGRLPPHPKYGQLVAQCVPATLFAAPRDLHEDKHLVFVRRIPSVRELTQRINEAYDIQLAERICAAWGLAMDNRLAEVWRSAKWSRAGFVELVAARRRQLGVVDEDVLDDDDTAPAEAGEGSQRLGSAIAELFVVKKGQGDRTDCSNVSLRFRKPDSAFAMFLEPASDYLDGGYDEYLEIRRGDRVRADYVTAARAARFRQHDRLQSVLESPSGVERSVRYDRPLFTLWSLIYPNLSPGEQKKLSEWASQRPDIAENFANYIKAGFLFASPVMVELYAWYTETNLGKGQDVQGRYAMFMDHVRERITDSLLLAYFKSALDSFERLCGKIIDHKPGDWQKDWRVLTSLQDPAWYASGETKNRQRLILGFNSPFYPNVLVSTSVFQEGVNLHIQCRKVHHYGIAGSPGDNEQRVGRVDRLFGKVNDLLKLGGLAELEINYPFLRNSLDEDQVASFIARKFHVEQRMDSCEQESFDRYIELTRKDWREFLRKPLAISVQDPYSAHFDGDSLPGTEYSPAEHHANDEVVAHLGGLLQAIVGSGDDQLHAVAGGELYPRALFLIDPAIQREDGRRHQPILVERDHSAALTTLVGSAVYFVSMKSPISSRAALDSAGLTAERLAAVQRDIGENFHLIRLVVDTESPNSHFYLHARVDLPVFVRKGGLAMLSAEELRICVAQLKEYSDLLEFSLHGGQKDLRKQDFMPAESLVELAPGRVNHRLDADSLSGGNWERIQSHGGAVERKRASISGSATALIESAGIEMDDVPDGLTPYVLNGLYPFIEFSRQPGGLQASVCYPSIDIQSTERDVLSKWLSHISHTRHRSA